jgi:uncharacterized membrane protein
MDGVAIAFEVVGAAVLVAGAVWAATRARSAWSASGPASSLLVLRRSFGTALLLGLEVFVAADLIRTVAVAPTLENVAVLGLIVFIRTFLSFSLQVEIDGVVPWKRALMPLGGRLPVPPPGPPPPEAAGPAEPAVEPGSVEGSPTGFIGRHEGPG